MKVTDRSTAAPQDRDDADGVKRFAAKHDISRAQVYKEIASGKLIARKVAGRTIITREDGAKWRRALPKMPVMGSSDRRTPSGDVPAWLSDTSETLHPGRHRAAAATAKQEKRYRKRRSPTTVTP